MPTNNFKPFGIGSGANVMSQGDYEALAALLTGFTTGKASSAQINKALRQATVMASVLAQFISDSAYVDVLDDGDTATLLTNFIAALTASGAESFLKIDNNLSDLSDVNDAKENLSLDKVGNYAAVQSGGGLHDPGGAHSIHIDWGDGDKLYATVDDTDAGEIFTTGNPPTASQTGALPLTGGELTGIVSTSSEIRSTVADNFRIVNGDRGTFWHQDGTSLYLMKTESGDQYGTYDSSRPIRVDLATGDVYINDARPYSASNCPFPVGYVMLMGSGTDPNGEYPGTEWEFLNASYDGRAIVLGQDVLGTGGSNTVTLTEAQSPPHRHNGGSTGDAGITPDDDAVAWGTGRFGTDNKGAYSLMQTSAAGGGEPFSVQNEYVHVLGWMRIA